MDWPMKRGASGISRCRRRLSLWSSPIRFPRFCSGSGLWSLLCSRKATLSGLLGRPSHYLRGESKMRLLVLWKELDKQDLAQIQEVTGAEVLLGFTKEEAV